MQTKMQRRAMLGAISALCVTLPVSAGELISNSNNPQSAALKIETLHPFTHFSSIPEGSDLSSIKFEGVQPVKVATQRRSTIDVRYCEEAGRRDPGGSMFCPSTQLQSPAAAYQVTYSYDGPAMASDEYGNRHYTFSVYFRPDELSPAAREEISDYGMTKAAAAALFAVSTSRTPVRRLVIDQSSSKLCARTPNDGSWTQIDPKCQERINYKTISVPSGYITVKIGPIGGSIRAD